jgi:hypothetical protein
LTTMTPVTAVAPIVTTVALLVPVIVTPTV